METFLFLVGEERRQEVPPDLEQFRIRLSELKYRLTQKIERLRALAGIYRMPELLRQLPEEEAMIIEAQEDIEKRLSEIAEAVKDVLSELGERLDQSVLDRDLIETLNEDRKIEIRIPKDSTEFAENLLEALRTVESFFQVGKERYGFTDDDIRQVQDYKNILQGIINNYGTKEG